MKKIAHFIGISALVCYAVTAISYYMNNKELLFAFEIVYFIGICLMLFYLGFLVYLQIKKKEVRENTHLVVSALIMLGILSFIYMIGFKHYRVFDVTRDKRYSVSDQTVKVLEQVDEDIRIFVFLKPGHRGKDDIEKILQQYTYYSERISYKFVDPQEQPHLAEKYAIDQFGQVIIETDEQQEKIDFPSEELITNTVLKLVTGEKKRIAFLTGHAEASLEDGDKAGYSLLKRHLELDNYSTEELLLLRQESVDPAIDVVVIASPKTELFDNEVAALKEYFDQGGSILAMIDPFMVESLSTMLTETGFDIKKGIIVDSLSQVFGASPLIPVISQYIPHPITEDFRVASFLPMAVFVDVAATLPEGSNGYALAYTGPGSWVETDLESLNGKPKFDKEAGDIPGPVPVFALIEGTATEEGNAPRIVLFGDSNFIDNANIGLSGNRDLFLNTVAWLARDENLISIRKKETDSIPMFLKGHQQILLFIVPVILLPLSFLLGGIFVMIKLRR